MTGFTTGTDYLTRTSVWDPTLKMVLEDELMATKYVRMIPDFMGDTVNMPSVGQATVNNYVEDQSVKFRAMDTGNFQFTITEYIESSTYITDKQKQNSFYADELIASFVPKQTRAFLTNFETKVMGLSSSQTASNTNSINGASHRFIGTGTGNTITIGDFAKAKYGLKKANVPMTDLIAIVDPSVEYTLGTLPNISNMSNNPQWEGIVSTGIATGMRFVRNIHGFDVYTSNYLADANETITATTTAGKANMFFSATPDVLPFIGQWKQPIRVESKRNIDFQRDEFVTTGRYGVKLYRPENLVCVLTDTNNV